MSFWHQRRSIMYAKRWCKKKIGPPFRVLSVLLSLVNQSGLTDTLRRVIFSMILSTDNIMEHCLDAVWRHEASQLRTTLHAARRFHSKWFQGRILILTNGCRSIQCKWDLLKLQKKIISCNSGPFPHFSNAGTIMLAVPFFCPSGAFSACCVCIYTAF